MRPGGSQALILVVGDEEDVRNLVREILRSAGYATLAAGQREDAVRIPKERPDVDLMLTDIMMPQQDGTTLARRVARGSPDRETLRGPGTAAPGERPALRDP